MTPIDRLRAKHFALRANPDLARDVRRALRVAFDDGFAAMQLLSFSNEYKDFNKGHALAGKYKAASKKKVKR